uniref:Chemokine interleukin-8-like domain-containing protein n=1 Tax=Pseudonaja textilis TaxID=8673 RepID=A0A670ZJL4_PSETE
MITFCDHLTSKVNGKVQIALELRCHCVKVFSHGISIGSIASVDFIPEGPHCIRPEVMKDGKQFCLNTTMPWVQRVIQRFTKVFMKIV